MRILHVVKQARHSGAEVLAASLCELHNGPHSTAYVSLQPAEKSFREALAALREAGVFLRNPAEELGKVGRIRWLRSALSDFEPDVVLAHSVIPAAYARVAAASLGRRNVISVLHSATNDDYAEEPFRTSERFLRRLSMGVVAVSPAQARNYAKRFVRPSPHVIGNGIDATSFRAAESDRNALRTRFGLSTEDKLILQVGRISPVKGQLLTAKAAEPLLTRDASIQLWFAGLVEDPRYQELLMTELDRWGSRAKWLGSRSDIPALIAAADVFVMPSSQEAHSIGILEALSTKVPIVTSDIEAFGFLQDFAGVWRVPRHPSQICQAIEDALSSPRASRSTDGFSIKKTSDDYLTLLSHLASLSA